nr:uncharacterized protein LOC115267582 isoform X2 [Aedes albopictus]
MTTLSQEQEQQHPSHSNSSQTQLLLLRQRSSEQELLQPNHRPLLAKASTIKRQQSCQQQRPLLLHSSSLGHHHHQSPPHYHHHHSHPRLSQKNRQKLFSRSRGYKSVCSGSGSQHACAGQSRCSKDHDEDIEACRPTKKGYGKYLDKQPFHPWPEEPSSVISERCTRARINSAIFVSSEGRGFDSIEFIRRYGSQSVLCRKARSAENVSAAERQRRYSAYPEWESEESKQQQNHTMNGYNNFIAANCNDPRQDSIELVECHKEPSSSSNPKATSSSSSCDNANSRPTPKLSNLPTLSVSGPSPPHEEEFLL